MPVSFFRAVKIRYGFSGGYPFIGLTAFVLRWLLYVDIHTYYTLYGLQNVFTVLNGFHAVLLHEKRLTASFQVPFAASVYGTPFLFVKIKRCWTVRRGWYEHFLRLHVATMPSSTVFRVTLPPEGWHARGERCPCCGERRHLEVSYMASMTYRNKTTFPARLMIFEHVE